MIILPNKNEQYVKEMNSLVFSDDIQEKILKNISKQKKKNITISVTAAALITCFLCIIMIKYTNAPNEITSEFLCEEDIETIEHVNSINDFKTDVNNNIDHLEIIPNQMVILNIQNIPSDTESLSLKGHITGDDRKYSLGYIADKNYTELLSDCTEELVNKELDIKDGTEYSFYIVNCSNQTLTFSGNIAANSNDLVYYDYGNESLQVEENGRLIIDLSGLSNSNDIEGIYVYNCITRQTIRFFFSRLIEYKSQQKGIYLIYAMTVDGEKIDLSKNVTIEYSIKEGNGVFLK